MDLIEEFYQNLRDYFIQNGIGDKNFYQYSSNFQNSDKIKFINLGILLNRASSREKNLYNKIKGNYYRITYALIFPKEKNGEFLLSIRLLSELNDIKKFKIKLLNSEGFLLNPFVKIVIDKFLNSDEYILNRVIFIEVELFLELLAKEKELKRVKRVDIKTKNKGI